MRLLHKTPQSLRSATARAIPPSRPTPDTPLCTAAVENVLSGRDPKGGRKACARLRGLPSMAVRTSALCRLDASSTLL